jgi:hypothetical protein
MQNALALGAQDTDVLRPEIRLPGQRRRVYTLTKLAGDTVPAELQETL